MRKVPFINGQFYHIYNRGVDARDIFCEIEDVFNFLQRMKEFNAIDPIGSIYKNSFRKNKLRGSTSQLEKKGKLVNIICYCLNPNHYHFILEQVADRGIEKFMHRLGTGYTMSFNDKYERTGALFQGRFKSVHINSNEQLLHTSIYVNLNNRVHQLRGSTSQLVRSSWGEYTNKDSSAFCKKDIILGQFKNSKEYIERAKNSLHGIIEKRKLNKESEKLFID